MIERNVNELGSVNPFCWKVEYKPSSLLSSIKLSRNFAFGFCLGCESNVELSSKNNIFYTLYNKFVYLRQ